MNLVNFSFRNRLAVFLFWLFILWTGIQSFIEIPITFSPKNRYLDHRITTVYPQAEKEVVFEKITQKLEQAISQNVPDIADIYTVTRDEKSEIHVYFYPKIAEEKIASQLALAISKAKNDLPSEASSPTLEILDDYLSPLFTLAVSSDLEPAEFYDYTYTNIKPYFEQIKGISHVRIIGERQKQATILLDLEKLKSHELSTSEVILRLKASGKNIIFGDDTTSLVTGAFTTLEEIQSIPLHFISNGKVILLKEIAEVTERLTTPSTYVYFNQKPCLMLEVYQSKNANEHAIEKIFPKKIKEYQAKSSSENISIFLLANRNPNIVFMYEDLRVNICISVAIAILIIWIVFRTFNSVFVSFTSIPLSLAGCFIILNFLDFTINIYVVMALIVSIGLVIDDIIVIRENIFRHLEAGSSPYDATMKGMREMIRPVVSTTLVILAIAFVLITIRMTPYTQYWRDFGVTLFVSMSFSLLESLTLGPLLCAYLLANAKEIKTQKNSILRFLESARHYRGSILLGFVVCSSSLFFIKIPFVADLFVPVKNIEIHVDNNNSEIDLTKTNQKFFQMSELLLEEYKDIKNLGLRVASDKSTMYIQMSPQSSKSSAVLKDDFSNKFDILRSNQEINNFSISNNVIPILEYIPHYSLEIMGNDLQEIDVYSQKFMNEIEKSNYLINLVNSYNESRNWLQYNLLRRKMGQLGIEITSVSDELDTLFYGNEINEISYSPKNKTHATKSEIMIQNLPTYYRLETVQNEACIPNLNHMLIPLKKFATAQMTAEAHPVIKQKNGKYLVEISGDANPQNPKANLELFTQQVTHKILPLPKGISTAWAGEIKRNIELPKLMSELSINSIIFILIILIAFFRSIILPGNIFFILPMAMAGSFIALAIMHSTINPFSMLGYILAIGIAGKNGIILLGYTQQLIESGLPPTVAISRAANARTRPILMTSIGVIFTTIPLFIKWNDYSVLQFSLGYALIGGIIMAIIANLLVLPQLFILSYPLGVKLLAWLRRIFNNSNSTSK